MKYPPPTFNDSVPYRRLAWEIIKEVLRSLGVRSDMLKRVQPDDPECSLLHENIVRISLPDNPYQSVASVIFFGKLKAAHCNVVIDDVAELIKPSSIENFRLLLEENDTIDYLDTEVRDYEHLIVKVSDMPKRLMFVSSRRTIYHKPKVIRSVKVDY